MGQEQPVLDSYTYVGDAPTKHREKKAGGKRTEPVEHSTGPELEPLLGDLGWRALLASPRSTSKEDVLSFVSLWEKLWVQSPTTFPALLRSLLLQHYPSDHKTALDVILSTFISFHPQYVASILDVFVDLMTTEETLRRHGPVYNRREAPFASLLKMYSPSPERDPASSQRLTIACREMLQHLNQRFLNTPSPRHATASASPRGLVIKRLCEWLTDCLIEAPPALREEHFQLLLDDLYRDLSAHDNRAEQRRLKLFRRFPYSHRSLAGKIDKMKAVILKEPAQYGGKLSLASSAVPLLLALHQRLMLEQEGGVDARPFSFSSPSLERRLLVPFAPVLFVYFSEPANAHSEKLVHQLLHSSSSAQFGQQGKEGGPLPTIVPLMDLLVTIFSSPGDTSGPHAEAVHAALADVLRRREKQQMPPVEPWQWFRTHFLGPLLQALAEGHQIDEEGGFMEAGPSVPTIASAPRVAVAEALLRRIFTSRLYAHLLYGPAEAQWQGEAAERKRQQLLASFVNAVSKYGKAVEAKVSEMWEETWLASSPPTSSSSSPSSPSISSSYDAADWDQLSWTRLKSFLAIYPVLPPLFRRVAERAFSAFLHQLPLSVDGASSGLGALERALFFFLLESEPSFAGDERGEHADVGKQAAHIRRRQPSKGGEPVFVRPFLILVRFLSSAPLPSSAYQRLQRYVARLLSILASNCVCSSAFESAIVAHLSSPSYPFPSSSSSSSSSSSGQAPFQAPASPLSFPSPSAFASPSAAHPAAHSASAFSNYSFAGLGVFSAVAMPASEDHGAVPTAPGGVLMSPYHPKGGAKGFQPRQPGGGGRKGSAHKREEEPSTAHAAERLKQTALLLLHALKAAPGNHEEDKQASIKKEKNEAEDGMDVEDAPRRPAVDEDSRFLSESLANGRAVEASFRCLASSEDPSARETILDLLTVLGPSARHDLWRKRSNVDLLVSLLHDNIPSVAAKAEPYAKAMLRDEEEGGASEGDLVELMLERTVGETDGERRREDGRLLTDFALLATDKAARKGHEGAQRIVSLIGRVADMLFIKRDPSRAPPASSSSSSSSSGSPHPLLVDLLAQLNAFLFASPVFAKRADGDDLRVFVSVDVLRRAMANAARNDEETKHQQLKLLSGSVLNAAQLLSADHAQIGPDAARYARQCLAFVEENLPLAVAGLQSTSEIVRDESVLILQRLLESQTGQEGAEVCRRVTACLDSQLRSSLLTSRLGAVASLSIALTSLPTLRR